MNLAAGEQAREDTGNTHILIGLALILVGAAFLANQLNWFAVEINGHFWPFVLIVLGIGRILAPGYRNGRRRSWRGGLWLLSIGIWGTICEFELFGLEYSTAWPLLIIAVGFNMVMRSFDQAVDRPVREH